MGELLESSTSRKRQEIMKSVHKLPNDDQPHELEAGSPVPRIGEEIRWGDVVIWEVLSIVWDLKEKMIVVECG